MQNLGYMFVNVDMLHLALSHRSVGAHNNERLEFLGDSVLNFIITDALFDRYPQASEGQLTRMRAQLVCADMLTEIAKELGLGQHVVLGSGERRSGGHQRSSILADSFEAITGAIYLDSGKNLSLLKTVILKLYENRWQIFEDDKNQGNKDPKTVLQELLQAKKLDLPVYEVIRIEGEQHDQTFIVECKVALLADPTIGEGNSRRKAEQIAAQLALEKIKNAG